MAQTVTAKIRVQSQASSCRIFGVQSDTWADLCLSTAVSIITPAPYSFVCDRGYINVSVASVIKQSTYKAVSLDDVWCHALEMC